MEAVVAARQDARKKIQVADHILTQTYPVVKDPKLLIAVLNNLYDGLSHGVRTLLLFKRGTAPETNDAQLALFQRDAHEYDIPASFMRMMNELRETIKEHKESPVEFARRGEFVICDESYRVRTLSPSQLRIQIGRAKEFIELVEEKTNDAIITRRN